MKKTIKLTIGKILLTIKLTDIIAWKLLILFEAANSKEKTLSK